MSNCTTKKNTHKRRKVRNMQFQEIITRLNIARSNNCPKEKSEEIKGLINELIRYFEGTRPKRKVIDLNEEDKAFQDLKNEWLTFSPTNEKELFAFIHKLTTNYNHDYGTSCWCAVAIMNACLSWVDKKEGFTGFQVSCVMWEVISKVFRYDDPIGLRMVRYSDLLYPQYKKEFKHFTISKEHAKSIQLQATKNLVEDKTASFKACPKVVKYWKKLAKGWLPRYIKVRKGE